MVDLTYYRLDPRPGNGFHFGRQGREVETSDVVFPSDSLFAALVATVAEQDGPAAVDSFMAPFLAGKPPFLLTSVFPRAGRLPLLPLPQLRIPTSQKDLPRKFAKEVRFASPAIWQRLCAGKEMNAYLDEDVEGRFLQGNAVWLAAAEQQYLPEDWQKLGPAALSGEKVWQEGTVPRVALDRATSASTIYQMGRVSFNAGCGLWLGVRYQDEAFNTMVESLLRHLGDRGLGGERSAGYGGYTLPGKSNLQEFPETAGNGYHLLLSRWLPAKNELDCLRGDETSYRLVSVGGWFSSPRAQALRRKQVHMLAEGSVVGGEHLPEPVGQIGDVTPDAGELQKSNLPPVPHPVYRYGLALAVPVMATPEGT